MHWKSNNTLFKKSGISGRDFLASFSFPPAKCTAHGTSHIVSSSHISSIYTTVGLHCLEREGNLVQGRCLTVKLAHSIFLLSLVPYLENLPMDRNIMIPRIERNSHEYV